MADVVPKLSLRDSMEEMKVVVSVAVEGSPGPVRVMVRLGATVEEAIDAIVHKYSSEGRSPPLNQELVPSFQLHHSHFNLLCLNRWDKIGDIGGRSFFLRTSLSFNSCGREAEIQSLRASLNCQYSSAIAKYVYKIDRRTKKMFKLLACFLCV